MVKRCLFLLLAAGLAPGRSPAQDTNAPPPSPAAVTNSAPDPAPDSLFNQPPDNPTQVKAPPAPATDEEAEHRAQIIGALMLPGMSTPGVRDQFEVYLGLAEIPADRLKQYRDQIAAIRQLLQNGDLDGASRGLSALARFDDLDGGVSPELTRQIAQILQSQQDAADLSRANVALRKEIDQYSWNTEQMKAAIDDSKKHKTPAPPETADYDSEIAKLADDQSQIKVNEVKAAGIQQHARDSFADFLSTLANNRRHDAVSLATDFYRSVSADGPLTDAMSQTADNSTATMRLVNDDLQNYHRLAAQGLWAGATNRLAEAYSNNPHEPGLLAIPRSEKDHVHAFADALDRLQNSLATRDFSAAAAAIDELKKAAPDFDATDPQALIENVKKESREHLDKAKELAAQSNDMGPVLVEFQAAADLWPANPDLQSMYGTYFKSQDVQSRTQAEFDRLFHAGDFRGIYDRSIAIAAAIRGDAVREEQWTIALDRAQRTMHVTKTARKMIAQGNLAGAWEIVDEATRTWPDDRSMGRLLADISMKGCPFSTAIQKARDAEALQEYGYSLNWYVNAQSLYPKSQIAAMGIERLSKLILTGEKTGSGPASP